MSQVDLQSVRDSVKYCCFLLEAEVTDSALLALSKEILSDKVCFVSREGRRFQAKQQPVGSSWNVFPSCDR